LHLCFENGRKKCVVLTLYVDDIRYKNGRRILKENLSSKFEMKSVDPQSKYWDEYTEGL